MKKLAVILMALCLGGSVGLAVTLTIVLFMAWQHNGVITLSFNTYHEIIAESILFPIWAIGGFFASYTLLKYWTKNKEA
jgi:hypothetical protein